MRDKKKVLFVATVVKGHIMPFHLSFLKMLQEKGYQTVVAARNDYDNPEDCKIPHCDVYYDIPFERSPIRSQNFKAYRQLKDIIDKNCFDIIHCHTPVGGLLGRLSSIKARKQGAKVIYTAHGFHFYKGAPSKNWLLYYPVEKICSYFTDVLITINKEDFALASKKFRAKKVVYVPGVGIDVDKFKNCDVLKAEKRKEIGVPEEATLFISVGELNANKNHATVIRAISMMENERIHYAVAGSGDRKEDLIALASELGIEHRVHLLGRRNDVAELYKAADCYVHPSFREGLPVAVMEAMAAGLPVACSHIRGNADLIDAGGGVLFSPHSVDDCKEAIQKLLKEDLTKMGCYNQEKIKDYSHEKINEMMLDIYLDKKI